MLLLFFVAVHVFCVCFAVLVTGLRAISDLIMILAASDMVFVAVVFVLREVLRLVAGLRALMP